ncbi:MAG: AI-2E family transporter [Verrucomicrobiales bacterium]|nr:AI-2E family transporter [Verrucomicrobiales bacterium]
MWAYPVLVLLIFVILQQINGLVTAPKIVGDSVGLHPLTVIFSVLFWSFLLGGLLGALLAVPLTAAIKVLFRRYLWERRFETAGGSHRAGEPDGSTDDSIVIDGEGDVAVTP